MLIVLFLVSHFNFLFVSCGGLSWLPVSFLLHVKYTLSYGIVCVQHSLDYLPLQGATARVLSVARLSQTTETTFNRQQFCSFVEVSWKDLGHFRRCHCWTKAVCLSSVWIKERNKCKCTSKQTLIKKVWYRKWWTKGKVQHGFGGFASMQVCPLSAHQIIKLSGKNI